MHPQPREHYTLNGPSQASELELLSLIIGTGASGRSTREIALHLLQRFGSARKIAQLPVAVLTQIPGLGPARAVRIHAACALSLLPEQRPALNRVLSPDDAALLLRPALSGRRREHLVALYLATSGRPLAIESLSQGSVDRTLVDPREVFRPALVLGARNVVLGHNHPSGDLNPSAEDLAVTHRVSELGNSLGVYLVDHLILAGGDFTSLAERGVLPVWETAPLGFTR
ncbi:MAG: DNA repair protein RadC [Myxococcota bacterium]|nr:DNA repair protein RadC [Myxococcota bacterium]